MEIYIEESGALYAIRNLNSGGGFGGFFLLGFLVFLFVCLFVWGWLFCFLLRGVWGGGCFSFQLREYK